MTSAAVSAGSGTLPSTATRNYSVDVFRFVAAVAVVLLHVKYRELSNNVVLLIRWGGRWAVPFFFIVSGYFFQRNYAKGGDQAFLKSLQTLVLITLAANLLFVPVNLWLGNGKLSDAFFIDLFTMNGHLWFMNSMIIGYVLLWTMLNRGKQRWLLYVANALIVFSLATNAYSLLLGVQSDRQFSMLVLSLPCLIYGYKASETQFIERYFTVTKSLGLIVIGVILQTAEILFLYKFSGYSPHNQEFLFGSLLFAFGIFALALSLRIKQDTVFSKFGRMYSLPVYLYHPMIVYVLSYSLTKVSAEFLPYALWLNPLLCVLITFAMIRLLDRRLPRVFRFINGQ